MRSTSLLAKSWWHKVLAQSCCSGSVSPASIYLILVLQSPMLVLLFLPGSGKEEKTYLDSWIHTADFLLLSEPVHEPNGCLRFSATEASQNILQSGDTQTHNSLPSILAIEWYLFRLCLNAAVFLSGAVFPSALFLFYLLPRVVLALKYHVCVLRAAEGRKVWWLLSSYLHFRKEPCAWACGKEPIVLFYWCNTYVILLIFTSLKAQTDSPWQLCLSCFRVDRNSGVKPFQSWPSQSQSQLQANFSLSDFFQLNSVYMCVYLCICMHVRVFMLHRHMWYVFICMHTW